MLRQVELRSCRQLQHLSKRLLKMSEPSAEKMKISKEITGTILFLYSDCFAACKQFWAEDIGLPLIADKGGVVFYKLPGTGGSLAVVKQGVSAAAVPPVFL